MKIALFSAQSYDKEYFERYNKDHSITYFEVALSKLTVELAHGFDAVCVFVNDKLDAETINRLADMGVKVIALRCAGFNNIDLMAAHSKGLKVFRVPAYSPEAVAEHTVALILTLNRKTHKAYNRVRENNFSIEHLNGFNLFGKTVGVIGTGNIGAAFCSIMLGFSCKVVAYDVVESESLKKKGVTYLPFDDVLRVSDIISLHCPLLPSTHHLINSKTYHLMKSGVMLINTSRGGLIDTADTIAALKSHKLGYLGIDVYEQEGGLFFMDQSVTIMQDDLLSRLMTFPNVLVTGHQGFFTDEAMQEIVETTCKNLSDYEEGLKVVNEIEFAGA